MDMKTIRNNIFCLAILTLFTACVPTMKYTWTRENLEPQQFDKILVLSIGKNANAREIFENTIVKALADEGIVGENSLSLFPPLIDVSKLSENAIESKIKASDYDAVIVSSLIDIQSKDVYVSESAYYPYPYRYPRHIYYGYSYAYQPGYYRQEKSFVIESRLFDAAAGSPKEGVLWSGQSEITDPRSYESGAEQHAYSMVKTLLKAGVLQK